MTFRNKTEARRWLSMMEADLARGRWDGDDSDGERLQDYAARWITERAGPSERSVALHEGLLRLHIASRLGLVGLRKITPALVRTWCQELLDGGVGPSTVAKAYRLLRAVLNTAADDELIRRRNPCRIKGAGVEHPAERPILTLTEVMKLADSIDPRYRLLVLLAVSASLRWGELMGLRKTDFDLEVGLVHVRRSVSLIGARQVMKTPKTAAGLRTVALLLCPEVEKHFIDYAELLPDGQVFVGPWGVTPARPNFSPIWARALAEAGLTGIHVYDLRHTGNHLAAISGASIRELMARMGHVSVDSALVYQHRTESRNRVIADSLDAMVRALGAEDPGDSGHGTWVTSDVRFLPWSPTSL